MGAIITWLPLFLFVILFGLSMDYHVFVVSRIREARLRGLTTQDAIQHGVVTTAGVVTSAAVIMVAVFAIFGTLSMQSMKQMGVGLAAAVLIDATIIRGVLLPAVMALLGERNWYLPKWLNRLPDLTPRRVARGRVAAAARRGGREGRGLSRGPSGPGGCLGPTGPRRSRGHFRLDQVGRPRACRPPSPSRAWISWRRRATSGSAASARTASRRVSARRLLHRHVPGDAERLEHVRVAELVDGLRYGDHRRARWPAPPGCRPPRRA